jgi:hypothetical protein
MNLYHRVKKHNFSHTVHKKNGEAPVTNADNSGEQELNTESIEDNTESNKESPDNRSESSSPLMYVNGIDVQAEENDKQKNEQEGEKQQEQNKQQQEEQKQQIKNIEKGSGEGSSLVVDVDEANSCVDGKLNEELFLILKRFFRVENITYSRY